MRVTFERESTEEENDDDEEVRVGAVHDDVERIRAVFEKFDVDSSGYLRTFDLSDAASEILGRLVTTREVWALVEASGTGHSGLDLSTFKDLMQRFDWDDEELKEPLPANLVEHWFHGSALGFGMSVQADVDRVVTLVTDVVDPSLAGIVEVGDRIAAINGSPVHTLDDPQVRNRADSLPQ